MSLKHPTRSELIEWADGDDEDARQLEAQGFQDAAAGKRRFAANQRAKAASWSLAGYILGYLDWGALGWGLCAAVAGSIVGGVVFGSHAGAQVVAIIGGSCGYMYGRGS